MGKRLFNFGKALNRGDLLLSVPRSIKWGYLIVGVIFIIAQVIPTMYSGLTEGFQYNSQALAIYISEGVPVRTDQIYPVDQNFFLFSRIGYNNLLSIVISIFPNDLFLASRIVTWLSLLIFCVSTFLFVRKISCVPWWLNLFILSLCQVAFFSSYLATDSLTSAAFAAAAMVVLVGSQGFLPTFLASILLGAAIVLRVETLLIIPFFALWVVMEDESWLFRFKRLGLSAVIVATIPNVFFIINGTSIFDIMRLSSQAVDLWDREFQILSIATILMIIAQPTLLVAAAIRAVDLVKNGDYRSLIIFVAPVVIYICFVVPQLYSSRQLLPVVPIIAALGASGIKTIMLYNNRAGKLKYGLASIVLVLTACVGFSYPVGRMEEGPRPFVGQVGASGIWWLYLNYLDNTTRDSVHEIARFAQTHDSSVVVSTDWHSDRLTHWALLKSGFRPVRYNDGVVCERYVEKFLDKQSHLVRHFRPHLPFIGDRDVYSAVKNNLLPCISVWKGLSSESLVVSTHPDALFKNISGKKVAGDRDAEYEVNFIDIKNVSLPPKIGGRLGYLPKVWMLRLEEDSFRGIPPERDMPRTRDLNIEAFLRQKQH